MASAEEVEVPGVDEVYLVCGDRGSSIYGCYIDAAKAHAQGKRLGAIVVKVPVVGDYRRRNETTRS